jgi:1,2-diacylglycerol 3-alpha-glucosyltransferase
MTTAIHRRPSRNDQRRNDQPLSLAFFIEGMSASGVDTSTQLLATELRRLGHRVVLFVPWKERCQHPDAIDQFWLPAMRVSRDQDVYWAYPVNLPLFEKFHQERFDLVHVHTNTVINLLAWQVAGLFRLPIVYTYHTMAKDYAHYIGPIYQHMSHLVDNAIERYDKLICDQADCVVTPSHKAERYLHDIGVNDLQVIPNGIDLRMFTHTPHNLLRQRFTIPTDEPILLFVGRLNQEKRPLLAYECFRALQRQLANVHLVMVGDGALRPDLEAYIEEDQLEGRVHLTGVVDYREMPAIYNSADVWVSTSCSEVHPMVAIESGACGLPAVAMRDAALEGVVENGINGFIVEDQAEFVKALLHLLNDRALHQQMRRSAARQARRFRIESTAQQMLDVYRSTIDQHKIEQRSFPFSIEKLQQRLHIDL